MSQRFPKLGFSMFDLHCFLLQLIPTDVATLMLECVFHIGCHQFYQICFLSLICTLCTPNSNSRLCRKLDASCPPFSAGETSLPLARHLVSPLHSNCSVSLNFLVQAPRHLFPMLVSYSTSFSRLDWVLPVIHICLSSLVAVRDACRCWR